MANTYEEWVHDNMESFKTLSSGGWLRECWIAATKAAEEKFAAKNKRSAQCPNLWHDGLHDGCGICPDCGETF